MAEPLMDVKDEVISSDEEPGKLRATPTRSVAPTAREEPSPQASVGTPKSPPCSQAASQTQAMVVNDDFGFSFPDIQQLPKQHGPDPTKAMLDAISQAPTLRDFNKALWPSDLFEGFATPDQIATGVRARLNEMLADDRTHRELAGRYDFHLNFLAPVPCIQAVKSFCYHHGLHAESFLNLLDSNFNFLENSGARLGCDPAPPGIDVLGLEVHGPEEEDEDSTLPQELDQDFCQGPKGKRSRSSKSKTDPPLKQRKSRQAVAPLDIPAAVEKVLLDCDVEKENARSVIQKMQTAAGRDLISSERKHVRDIMIGKLAQGVAQDASDQAPAAAGSQDTKCQVVDVEVRPQVRIHSISPNKAVMVAASASDRKTFLTESTTAPCLPLTCVIAACSGKHNSLHVLQPVALA